MIYDLDFQSMASCGRGPYTSEKSLQGQMWFKCYSENKRMDGHDRSQYLARYSAVGNTAGLIFVWT